MSDQPSSTLAATDLALTRLVCGVPTSYAEVADALREPFLSEMRTYPVLEAPPQLVCTVAGNAPATFDGSANPSAHVQQEGGFVARYRDAAIRYSFDGDRICKADVYLTRNTGSLERAFRRWISIQYTDAQEALGQIIHELVAVPAAALTDGLAPVHAGAFAVNGRAMLIGGIGGVGKTTLTARACMEFGADFVADDIAVVGEDGSVYPNLAYPKVYAYNAEADPGLRSAVTRGRGVLDRTQWWLRRRFGPGAARRRVSPLDLFGKAAQSAAPIGLYAVLIHSSAVDQPRVRELDRRAVARMSAEIMRNEYEIFLRHLAWRNVQQLATDQPATITVDGLVERWTHVVGAALAHATCAIVEVPGPLRPEAQRLIIRDLIHRGSTG